MVNKIYTRVMILLLAIMHSHWHSLIARQQTQLPEVRGQVSDTTGNQLSGVSITVKGRSSIGTTTDLNGMYFLQLPEKKLTLVFSMVGYTTQEVELNGRERVDVVLQETSSLLDDVVVVAFGKQKKQDVIGAVTSVSPSDLKIPSSNLTTAFAGRIAGMIAYQRSGEPGQDNAAFFIRGVTTFGYKRDPLILIDGVELSTTELARLQPDDIASFSILKDATATALYGARGANGVILIATKEGKAGTAKVSLRYESAFSSPTKNVELADPITYMRLHNEAVLTRNPLGVLPYPESKIDNTIAGANPYVFPANDWRKELFNDYAVTQRANFNVTGGGQIAQYYLAGTFNKDNGVLRVNGLNNFNNNIDLRSYALRSNVNISVTKSTQVNVRLYGTFDDYTGPIHGGTQMYHNVMRSNAVMFPATFPADEDHRYLQHILFGNAQSGSSSYYLNPYAEMVKGYRDYSKSLMLAQFEVKQDLSSLVEGLSFRAMGNTNREAFFDVSRAYEPFWYQYTNYDKYTQEYGISVMNPEGGREYLDWAEGPKTVRSTLYVESALNYNRTFADKHGISGLVIFNMRDYVEGNASSLQASMPYRNMGFSGRATYSYDNRYFAEFNFGYNGSERFYQTERFGFFPSGGVAWSVSNEAFMKPLADVVSKLKLRATYGLVGNDAIGSPTDRFFYLSNVDMGSTERGAVFGTDNNYNRPGVNVTRYDNRFITWETSRQTNIGIELGLFNKIDIQADYFNQYRYNILQDRASIPTTMGLSSTVRANVGEAASSGIDMSIDYSNHFSRNVWLTTRGNFTYATSEFKVFEEPQYYERNLSRIGYPISQQWGYIAERLFVDENDVANSPVQNFGKAPMGGDIKYVDVNGDGEITTLDRVPIGYPTDPEIIYGFGFTAGFKQFDISAFFQGSARSSFWINTTNAVSGGAGTTEPFVSYYHSQVERDQVVRGRVENQLLKAYADDHWSEENRNIYALWPRLDFSPNANNNQLSTWFMRNGAFLRLKTVELGYTLPERHANRLRLSTLRMYATATNWFTLSYHQMWDVEMGASGLGYPIQKVLNFGLQVGF